MIRLGFKKNYLQLIVLALVSLSSSCSENTIPKPRGYFRITFPEKEYTRYESDCPYTFEYPVYAKVVQDKEPNAEPCWINIDFPTMKGKIHVSYKSIKNNFDVIEEDSRNLAYKHTIKADAINEKLYMKPEKKIYGIYYEIKGNAASSIQFFVTDSTEHFLRGSLYFNVTPNKDSLAPVIDFISVDIQHLMETFEWKN